MFIKVIIIIEGESDYSGCINVEKIDWITSISGTNDSYIAVGKVRFTCRDNYKQLSEAITNCLYDSTGERIS